MQSPTAIGHARQRSLRFTLPRIAALLNLVRLTFASQPKSRLVYRHVNGDWGCFPEEDKLENQRSVENGYRVMSSYKLNDCGDKLWIITEADRSSTCLLLPEEY